MANDFQRNFMARGMHGNMGVVPGIAQHEVRTTGYSYNNDSINSSAMSISDMAFDYMNSENAMNSTHGLYGAIPTNSNNLYSMVSTPSSGLQLSPMQQLELKLVLAQSTASQWKEAYDKLLLRIGPLPNNPTFAVPNSNITSPVVSSFKSECTPLSLTGPSNRSEPNEMKPVKFLHARNELLQLLFAPAFTSHQRHEEMDAEDHPLISYWHQSNYQINIADNSNGQLSDKIAYLEDEDGNIVDKNYVTNIRADLRSKFNQILANLPRALQAKWTQYDMEFQQAVYWYLRTKYIEFTFCKDNWKAKSFVSNWYSNWFRNTKKKEQQAQQQEVLKAKKPVKTIVPSKRCSDEELPGPSKSRQRSESEVSLPGLSTSRQRSESEVSLPGPSTSRQRSESETSTSLHQSSEDMPSHNRIVNNLKLKPVPLIINITDKDDTAVETEAGVCKLPALDRNEDTDIDGVPNKTGEIKDKSPALSIPFHAANSLLAGNSSTTVTTHTETQATTSHTKENYGETSTEHQANATSPVDTTNTDIAAPVTSNARNIQGKAKKTVGNRKKRVYPNSTTPENLFALDFQKQRNGKGTTDEFNAAWEVLSAQDKQLYQEQSAQRKTGE